MGSAHEFVSQSGSSDDAIRQLEVVAVHCRRVAEALSKGEGRRADLEKCYTALAGAADLVVEVWFADPSLLSEALQILAEAQAMVRVALLDAETEEPDDGQVVAFEVLRKLTHERSIRIRRYMTMNDAPDPEEAPLLLCRVRDMWFDSLPRVGWCESGLGEAKRSKRRRPVQKSGRVPKVGKSIQDGVLRTWQQRFSSRLVFTERACVSAKNCEWIDVGVVQRAMAHMHDTLWTLFFCRDSGNIETEFGNATGVSLSMRERKLTQRNSRLRALRRVQWGGQRFDMTPHVKLRCNGRLVRIHFAVDRVRRLIVIGWCGSHLPTSGTRYIR